MRRPILVIEDSDEDFEVLRESLRASDVDNELIRCGTAREVSAYLARTFNQPAPQCPVFVLLDLNIPGGDGRSILLELRSHNILKSVPVIILTTSDQQSDIQICYRQGASGYIVKPVDLDLFETMIKKMTSYWLNCVHLPQLQFGQA